MRVSGHFQDSVFLPLRKASSVPVGYRTQSTSVFQLSWQGEKYILSCNAIQLGSNVIFDSGFCIGCHCQIYLFSSIFKLVENCIEIMKIHALKLCVKIDTHWHGQQLRSLYLHSTSKMNGQRSLCQITFDLASSLNFYVELFSSLHAET
jgi:hypothetical protein